MLKSTKRSTAGVGNLLQSQHSLPTTDNVLYKYKAFPERVCASYVSEICDHVETSA